MLITDLPADQRPRERLQSRGAQALTDAELLAIVLRTGIQGKNAIQLGRDLLDRFGSVSRLLSATPTELAEIKGMGPSKCSLLQAVVELARRGLAEELRCGPLLQSPQAVSQFLRLRLHGQPSETFLGLFLDVQGRLIACEEMGRGTLTRAHVYPSGSVEPSKMDKMLTTELKRVLACIEVSLLDHVIVNDHETWSFKQHGLC